MFKFLQVIFIVALLLMILVFVLYKKTAFFTFYQNHKNTRLISDIAYKEGSINKKQLLDLYLPKNRNNFPIVYFVHGGSWRFGDKNYHKWILGLYGNIGVTLAKNGIGVAVTNYRLFPEANTEEQVSDIEEGIGWLKNKSQNYGGSGKVFLMGHSAGGHLALLLTLKEKISVDGIIALSAVWDINDMILNAEDNFNKKTSIPIFGKDAEHRKNYSPINYLSNISSPIFIAAGSNDYSYLKKQADLARDEISKTKISNKYFLAPKYSHTDMVTKFGSKSDKLIFEVLKFIESHNNPD